MYIDGRTGFKLKIEQVLPDCYSKEPVTEIMGSRWNPILAEVVIFTMGNFQNFIEKFIHWS